MLERWMKQFGDFVANKWFGLSPKKEERIRQELRTGQRKTMMDSFADKVTKRAETPIPLDKAS